MGIRPPLRTTSWSRSTGWGEGGAPAGGALWVVVADGRCRWRRGTGADLGDGDSEPAGGGSGEKEAQGRVRRKRMGDGIFFLQRQPYPLSSAARRASVLGLWFRSIASAPRRTGLPVFPVNRYLTKRPFSSVFFPRSHLARNPFLSHGHSLPPPPLARSRTPNGTHALLPPHASASVPPGSAPSSDQRQPASPPQTPPEADGIISPGQSAGGAKAGMEMTPPPAMVPPSCSASPSLSQEAQPLLQCPPSPPPPRPHPPRPSPSPPKPPSAQAPSHSPGRGSRASPGPGWRPCGRRRWTRPSARG